MTVIQVYASTSNAEEVEVEWFYEDLQDLLELTPERDVLFIIGHWNSKDDFCPQPLESPQMKPQTSSGQTLPTTVVQSLNHV